jgi:hypothetical protein
MIDAIKREREPRTCLAFSTHCSERSFGRSMRALTMIIIMHSLRFVDHSGTHFITISRRCALRSARTFSAPVPRTAPRDCLFSATKREEAGISERSKASTCAHKENVKQRHSTRRTKMKRQNSIRNIYIIFKKQHIILCNTHRMSRFDARCSIMCAAQPAVRAITKMGVKKAVGLPH